jgi:hypothetical protein
LTLVNPRHDERIHHPAHTAIAATRLATPDGEDKR